MKIITQIGKITQKPQKGVFMTLILRSLKQECKFRSSRAFARTAPGLAHRPRGVCGWVLMSNWPGATQALSAFPAWARGALKGSRAGEEQTS